MAKKIIRVHTPFNFNFEDGSSQRFELGEHTVDDKVADHWFVVAHAEVTGKAKAASDAAAFQSQIDSLTAQLADKDGTITELQTAGEQKDQQIAILTAQLAELQKPVVEETNDGKKSKSSDDK